MKTIEEMLKDYTDCKKQYIPIFDDDDNVIESEIEEFPKIEEYKGYQAYKDMELFTERTGVKFSNWEKIFRVIETGEEFKKLDRKVQLLYRISDKYYDCVEFVDNGIRVRALDGEFDCMYDTIEEVLIDYLDDYVETFYEECGSWEEDIDFLREIKNNFK